MCVCVCVGLCAQVGRSNNFGSEWEFGLQAAPSFYHVGILQMYIRMVGLDINVQVQHQIRACCKQLGKWDHRHDNITYIQTHTHIHAYVHMYTHTYIRTYVHTYVHTYIRTYVHTYVRMYVRTYVCTYVHTYIQYSTYIHTKVSQETCAILLFLLATMYTLMPK